MDVDELVRKARANHNDSNLMATQVFKPILDELNNLAKKISNLQRTKASTKSVADVNAELEKIKERFREF